jgi:hypothetical protein
VCSFGNTVTTISLHHHCAARARVRNRTVDQFPALDAVTLNRSLEISCFPPHNQTSFFLSNHVVSDAGYELVLADDAGAADRHQLRCRRPGRHIHGAERDGLVPSGSMGVAVWIVWQQPAGARRDEALRWYTIQLVFNAIWSPAFFSGYPVLGNKALWIAVAIILALDFSVVQTLGAFQQVNSTAGLLLVPYLMWILFATTLNIAIAYLN